MLITGGLNNSNTTTGPKIKIEKRIDNIKKAVRIINPFRKDLEIPTRTEGINAKVKNIIYIKIDIIEKKALSEEKIEYGLCI